MLLRPERRLNGRLWAVTVDAASMGGTMGPHDIVVIGDRADAQRRAVELGVALLVTTYGSRPERRGDGAGARAAAPGIVLSPLDSYVTGRLVSQSVPAREVMGRDPLTAEPDDLLSDIADRIKDVDYSAAIVVDDAGVPGRPGDAAPSWSTRARAACCWWTTASRPRACPASSEAHIVEILDHHHIGSIETRFPVAATFDPVGSTATLVVERFRSAGREPQRRRRPRCCWRRSSRTRSSSARRRPPSATTGWSSTSRSSCELDARAFGIGDVRGVLRRRRRARVGHHPARRQGVRGAPGQDGLHRPDRDRRPRPHGAARRSCWSEMEARPRRGRPRRLRADGHRHRGRRHRPAGGGRPRARSSAPSTPRRSTASSTCPA